MGDLHEVVLGGQVLWEEWDLGTAAAGRSLLCLQWRAENGVGSGNHSVKNCCSWRWNTHRAGLFIFLWPQAAGPLFHLNYFASSCCHFPGTAAN